MVDVRSKRCSYGFCNKGPNFNCEGKKESVYCKQHAVDRMLNVRHSERCAHNSCTKRPVWGLATDCTATVCSHHKRDILGGPIIHFRAVCKIAGCRKQSRWGPLGQQPTHCHDHGPFRDGLVCISAILSTKSSCASPPNQAVPGSSFQVKPECSF